MHYKKSEMETTTYCSLPLVLRRIKMADDRSEKQIIEGYFHRGYQNYVILEFLSVYHKITTSLSTLKRRLRAYGLRRVRNKVNEQEGKYIVTRKVNNGCGSLGYRAISQLLPLEYHLHVPRHLVARIAKEVDPYARGGGGVLPYMGYIGMCLCEGYGFQAVYSPGQGI